MLTVKKVYVAARFHLKERVRSLYEKLKRKGYEISFDWTLHKWIIPYEKNVELARQYSEENIEGVANSDIFILLTDEERGGTGMYVELGVAILSYKLFGKPKIYVVGEDNSYALFYFHPSVIRKNSIEEVLEEL